MDRETLREQLIAITLLTVATTILITAKVGQH